MSDNAPKVPQIGAMPLGLGMPNFYANGFSHSAGPVDMSIVFLWNERPVGSVTMGLGAAKTYAKLLLSMISDVERVLGEEIKTIEDMNKLVDRQQATKP